MITTDNTLILMVVLDKDMKPSEHIVIRSYLFGKVEMLECNIVVMHNFLPSIFGSENLWEPIVIPNRSKTIHERRLKININIIIRSFRKVFV